MASEDRRDYLKACAQEARLLKASRMIPETGELSLDERRAVLEDAHDYIKQRGITYGQLARQLGTSLTYISGVFNWCFAADRAAKEVPVPPKTIDRLVRQINKWMEADYAARLAQRPEHFVHTRVAELIMTAAINCKKTRTIGIVDGPAGIGKTVAAEFVAGELPGTMIVRIDYDSRSASGLLRCVHQACRLRRKPKARATLREIVDRLKGSNRLLILDQAHDLQHARCFQLLMDLHDECQLPILLLGTVDIHRRLRDDEDPNYGQMSSRIGIRVHLLEELLRTGRGGRLLQWVSLPQLRKMFASTKLRIADDVWGHLARIANFDVGHLRRVKHLLRLAEGIARSAKQPIVQAAHLQAALQLVEGEHRPLPPLPPDEGRSAEAG